MPKDQRVHQRSRHDVASLLGFRGVDVVDVQRMVVHREQAKQVVLCLGNGLGGPVLVNGADLELLQIAAVRLSAARLARGLVGLDGQGLGHGGSSVSSNGLSCPRL